jgi:hypothetical protein
MVFINPTTLSIMGIFRHAGFSKPVVVTTEYIDLVGKGRTSNSIMSASGHPMELPRGMLN